MRNEQLSAHPVRPHAPWRLVVREVSWRRVFACVIPFAIAAALIVPREDEGTHSRRSSAPIDYGGASLVTFGLARLVAGLILAPRMSRKTGLVTARSRRVPRFFL
jgi:hypothetical protein